MAIVNDENWIDVLKNKSWEQSHVATPLRKLIIKLPCTSNLNLIQIFKQGVNKLQKNALRSVRFRTFKPSHVLPLSSRSGSLVGKPMECATYLQCLRNLDICDFVIASLVDSRL